jgi:hypothetical protein
MMFRTGYNVSSKGGVFSIRAMRKNDLRIEGFSLRALGKFGELNFEKFLSSKHRRYGCGSAPCVAG